MERRRKVGIGGIRERFASRPYRGQEPYKVIKKYIQVVEIQVEEIGLQKNIMPILTSSPYEDEYVIHTI